MRRLLSIALISILLSATASAQIFNWIRGRGGAPVYNLSSCVNDFFGTSTVNFTGVDFGVAETNRLLVLGIALSTAAAGESITSVTVGGQAATSVAMIAPPAEAFITSLWRVRVPILTSGNVDIVATGTINTATVSTYRVITATDAPSDTVTDTVTGFSDPTVMVDIPANGIAIGIATTQIGAEFTWTGLTEDCRFGNSGIVFGERATASFRSLVALLNRVVTIDTGGQADGKKLIVAAWPIN